MATIMNLLSDNEPAIAASLPIKLFFLCSVYKISVHLFSCSAHAAYACYSISVSATAIFNSIHILVEAKIPESKKICTPTPLCRPSDCSFSSYRFWVLIKTLDTKTEAVP